MKRWVVYYETSETRKATFTVTAPDFEAAFEAAMKHKPNIGHNAKLRGIYFQR